MRAIIKKIKESKGLEAPEVTVKKSEVDQEIENLGEDKIGDFSSDLNEGPENVRQALEKIKEMRKTSDWGLKKRIIEKIKSGQSRDHKVKKNEVNQIIKDLIKNKNDEMYKKYGIEENKESLIDLGKKRNLCNENGEILQNDEKMVEHEEKKEVEENTEMQEQERQEEIQQNQGEQEDGFEEENRP